jgi:hypothetical protein
VVSGVYWESWNVFLMNKGGGLKWLNHFYMVKVQKMEKEGIKFIQTKLSIGKI